MPRRCIIPVSNRKGNLVLLLILLAVSAATAFLFWPTSEQALQPDSRLIAASENLDEYTYSLRLDPAAKTLAIEMDLRMQNRTGTTLGDIVLRTYAGAYQLLDTSPAASRDLFDKSYPNGFSAGGLTLQEVSWQDKVVSAAFDDTAQTILRVSIPDFGSGTSGRLKLRLVLTIPECLGRYGYYDDTWCFGNILPILSVFSDGAWRAEPYCSIGDPFVSQCANYTVHLAVPQGYTCAASAAMRSQPGVDGSQVYDGRAYAVRDFAFIASSRLAKVNAVKNGVLLSAYAATGKEARLVIELAAKSLATFSSRYGEYPYPQLTICAVPLPFGGMEYPCMLMLNSSFFAEGMGDSLELLIAHEAAHQWFYAIVGSDQFYQPWQDEALCEYAVLQYVRDRYGVDAYDSLRALRVDAPMQESIPSGITPGSPIDYFTSMNEYSSVVYGRGAALFIALDTATGGILPFLKLYVKTFSYKIASRDDFESLLNSWSGQDLTPLLTDYLDTSM
jgi:hypothetical protein